MMENKIIDTVMLPLSKIKENKGQIDGVPANPRILVGDRFDRLCKSIKDNPEMLEIRELLVYEQDGEYITIGGNMRLQALRYLRHEQAPCKIVPSDSKEEINEDELDKLAVQYACDSEILRVYEGEVEAFKAGYRKAKQEL